MLKGVDAVKRMKFILPMLLCALLLSGCMLQTVEGRASGLTPVVSKSSAGAIEHLAIAKVVNIASTVESLKEKGVWVYAAEAGGQNCYQTDFSGPCAIVLGSEGDGVSKLVTERCDAIVSIPMYGKVNSFNVSTAAAVLLSQAKKCQMDKLSK